MSILKRHLSKVTENSNILLSANLFRLSVNKSDLPAHKSFKRQLIHAITNQLNIPMKYLYASEYAHSHWMKFYENPKYTFRTNSVLQVNKRGREISSLINPHLKKKSLTIVSLGPGGSLKEPILLKYFAELTKRQRSLTYIPVEINFDLLIDSMLKVDKIMLAPNFSQHGILADFTALPDYKDSFLTSNNPTLYLLFGNSFGNSDEVAILQALKSVLKKGDFLLIEFNSERINDESLKSVDLVSKEHDFSPLVELGFQFKPHFVNYQLVENQSLVPNTTTVLTTYKRGFVDNQIFNNIRISTVHHYQPRILEAFLNFKLKMQTLGTWRFKNVNLHLHKKI